MHFVEDDATEHVPAARQPQSARRAPPPSPDQTQPRPRWHARCADGKDSPSASIGRATDGRLRDGCELPKRGPGYARRNRDGWGTDESVALIQWAASEVLRLYPRSARVVIGALSRSAGGRLGQHKSHQSGRDADIGYFASNNRPLKRFTPMGARNLDVQKSWALIGALLSTGRVQYIFMDYNLQALFYRHLEDMGTDSATLARIFQFPAGRAVRRGVIRHAAGHRDHFHVRFHCPASDGEECIP